MKQAGQKSPLCPSPCRDPHFSLMRRVHNILRGQSARSIVIVLALQDACSQIEDYCMIKDRVQINSIIHQLKLHLTLLSQVELSLPLFSTFWYHTYLSLLSLCRLCPSTFSTFLKAKRKPRPVETQCNQSLSLLAQESIRKTDVCCFSCQVLFSY